MLGSALPLITRNLVENPSKKKLTEEVAESLPDGKAGAEKRIRIGNKKTGSLSPRTPRSLRLKLFDYASRTARIRRSQRGD
jgi:hypothetical protein